VNRVDGTERLWAPWRHQYVAAPQQAATCLFCDAAVPGNADSHYVITRRAHSLVMLNAFPYNVGHLLIAPYLHTSSLTELGDDALVEMMRLAREMNGVLEGVFHPHGVNVGMNVGAAAGAGIRDHIHLHVVPRWDGDTNFMYALSGTRVMSQSLEEAAALLRGAVSEPASGS